MKNAGSIFSFICLTIIISIHLLRLLKPFEWQRYEVDPIKAQQALKQSSARFYQHAQLIPGRTQPSSDQPADFPASAGPAARNP